MLAEDNDTGKNQYSRQFGVKTLFALVASVAVLCALFRPGPTPLVERWSKSTAITEEALIAEFGPPQQVCNDLVERLKKFKLRGMATGRWLQWTDSDQPDRVFIAVVVDGKASQKLEVQLHDDGRTLSFPLKDSL